MMATIRVVVWLAASDDPVSLPAQLFGFVLALISSRTDQIESAALGGLRALDMHPSASKHAQREDRLAHDRPSTRTHKPGNLPFLASGHEQISEQVALWMAPGLPSIACARLEAGLALHAPRRYDASNEAGEDQSPAS